ncbi:MAG: glycerophosphodiester phosphodiesterase family protein [Actinomycetota bacterium]
MKRSVRAIGFVAVALAAGVGGPISRAAEHREPLLVAHRGLARQAPENTLAAYGACLSLGLGFETDVRRTRDGRLVIVHDETVDRTTNGKGVVTDLEFATIRALDAGSWFHPVFRNERVPTLDDTLKLVAERGRADTLVAIDLKGEDVRIEANIVAAAKRRGVLSRLVFIGRAINTPEVRTRLREADPKARAARLAQTPKELPAAVADPGCQWAYLRFVPSPAQVNTVHRAGKRVFIAGPTVAEKQPENWRAAAEAGADAFLTDEPLEARAAMASPRP